MQYAIHLVCGSTGAGKTTYARELAARIGGVRFSIDEWMSALFWMDSPTPIEAGWSLARVERCCNQIWSTASGVAALGIPCVLDLGFTRAESRERIYALANAQALSVQLHLLDVPAGERWRRVQARNAQQGSARQLPFAVSREMFEFVETLWEPPDPGEMAAHAGLAVDPS
jgi:predicted kinase